MLFVIIMVPDISQLREMYTQKHLWTLMKSLCLWGSRLKPTQWHWLTKRMLSLSSLTHLQHPWLQSISHLLLMVLFKGLFYVGSLTAGYELNPMLIKRWSSNLKNMKSPVVFYHPKTPKVSLHWSVGFIFFEMIMKCLYDCQYSGHLFCMH